MKKLSVLLVLVILVGCTKVYIERGVPVTKRFRLDVPRHFEYPDVYSTFNPLSEEGVALGRKLFYDPILSGNNTISCGSCHHQGKGFSDGIVLSNKGFSGTTLLRHAPALINVAWMDNGVFWDGGSTNLESQALAPLAAHDEMFQNLYELENELKESPEYVRLFADAFGEVTISNMLKGLAQFQRTFISAYSKYDDYVLGKAYLTRDEMQGMRLVQQKCQGCHSGVLFTDNLFHNNGLDDDFSDASHDGIYWGRYRVSSNPKDMGAFKTPTLRNIMVSAPYMHDGRLASIEDVLNHYSDGVKLSPSTDSLVIQKPLNRPGIPLTAQEKSQIIAFLKTLTDAHFLSNRNLMVK